MIVQVKGAYKSFGAQDIFNDLNVLIKRHEKVAIIGANGVGKTTLFRVLSGQESLDKGNVFWRSNIRTGFLEQITISDDNLSVKDFLYEVFEDVFKLQEKLHELEEKMKTDHSDSVLSSYDRIQNQFMMRGGYTYETEVQTLLTQFNFKVEDLDRNLSNFSGGQVTRLGFIRLLLSKPDILFLDEPTNHLDISTIEWLEGYLANYQGAVFKAKVRGGKEVLVMKDLAVGYKKPLITVSETITRGKRFALVGDNGTGKSTLLKTVSGRMDPLSGDMLLGHQIQMGYFDQQLLDFVMNKTVLEEVWDEFSYLDHTEIRTALGRFLFKGEDVFKSVSVLSGGERVRLSLVKLMLRQDNFLVLDEPTNHLDILGKEALEKALINYDGTMLFVSHDRYFIDKIATDILMIDGDSVTHVQKKMSEVLSDKKETQKEEKKTSKEEFVNYKKLQRDEKKLEESLLLLYEELSLHRESRYDPDIYHDFEKMNELNQVIDDIHNEIKAKEETWARIVTQLEEE